MDKHVSAGGNLELGNKCFPPAFHKKNSEAESQQILAKAGREGDLAKGNPIFLFAFFFFAVYLHARCKIPKSMPMGGRRLCMAPEESWG